MDGPATKKSRKAEKLIDPSKTRPCRLALLPLELLAEILSHTSSPADVLALARCNKAFFSVLVNNPATVFVWRRARAQTLPAPIPDPTPNFHEAAYAAFIFDSGACTVCGNGTARMYVSFALRERVCDKRSCMDAWYNGLLEERQVGRYLDWLPIREDNKDEPRRRGMHLHLGLALGGQALRYWPDAPVRYSKAQVVQAQDDYNKILLSLDKDKLLQEKKAIAERKPRIMAHAVELAKWKYEREELATTAKQQREVLGRAIALREGWTYFDFINTPTLHAILKAHNACAEELTEAEYAGAREAIAADMVRFAKRRQLRDVEARHEKRAKDIEALWRRLCTKGEQAMPCLREFRALPVLQTMQRLEIEDGRVEEQMGTALAREMLRGELQKWRERAVEGLVGKIVDEKQEAGMGKEEMARRAARVDARFSCGKCGKVSRKYEEDGCLDFAGVCGHVCPETDKKKRQKVVWSVEQFVPEVTVRDAIAQVAASLGVQLDDADCRTALNDLGPRILCQSCDARIVMDFKALIGHARRHEHIRVCVVAQAEADAILAQPLELGLVARLMDRSRGAVEEHSHKIYGCRHCIQRVALPPRALIVQGAGSDDRARDGKGAPTPGGKDAGGGGGTARVVKLWDLNGLRSHAKARHGVACLRDEDMFRIVI